VKVMHVDASAKRERSNSRALSRYFLERLRGEGVDLEIDYLDVTVDTPPHVSEAFAIATYTPANDVGVIGCAVQTFARSRRTDLRHAHV
jgi:FMN-dependent NADH-azoreductase